MVSTLPSTAISSQGGGVIGGSVSGGGQHGTFRKISDVIRDHVGDGNLTAHVYFDQIYAQYQHEGFGFLHQIRPGAKYIERALLENYNSWMQYLAECVLPDQPNTLREAMVDIAEDMAHESEERAPMSPWRDLCNSANPIVRDGAVVVYNRAPRVPRLPQEYLTNVKNYGHYGLTLIGAHEYGR
jgi:hypothetical protein